MKRKSGKTITKTVARESYKAYVPYKLPPTPAIELDLLYAPLEKATMSLGKLNSMAKTIKISL